MSFNEQKSRWVSRHHVGAAKPVLRGFLRRGHLSRHYRNLPDHDVFSYTPGLKGPNAVWYGEWVADSDYIEIPNVLDAQGDNDFEQNGVETVTVEIDNIVMKETTGAGGMFHAIKRGYLAPLRGDPGYHNIAIANKNEYFDKFKDRTQITLVGGYGEAFFPLFTGLIDDVDLTSRPDKLTVVARNMGIFLTDQHTFMDAKHLWVRDPITFADRQKADTAQNVVAGAEAKSTSGAHPVRFAIDEDDETAWISDKHGSPDELEWMEVHLPPGRYEDFDLFPAFAGMDVYVSVYATNTPNQGSGPAIGSNTPFVAHTTDGVNVGEGWIDHESLGHVPGTDIPFVKRIQDAKEKSNRYRIRSGGGGYVIGDNSRLRLWFRDLAAVTDDSEVRYRAGVRDLKVFDRTKQQTAVENHWILVDDVSDIVKTVLQWAGLHNWQVESVGVRLKDKLVFDRQTYLIDIIRKIAEMTSYIFYVKPPATFDLDDLDSDTNLSMGVPIFRQNNAMKATPLDDRYVIRETDLLTGVHAKFSNEPLADSIRVRGRNVNKDAAKDAEHVHALGADRTKRFQYSYRPVWARRASNHSASLRRHTVHYDEQVHSVYEAKVGCLFIAFRQALEAAKGEIEFPFFPPIQLDHQIVVFDTGTGLSTRIYIVQRAWHFHGGEQASFTMSVGGSLIDTNDVQDTRQELQQILNHHGFDPHPIARGPWTDPRFF